MNVNLNRYKIHILFDLTYVRFFFAPTRRSLCKDAPLPSPRFFVRGRGVSVHRLTRRRLNYRKINSTTGKCTSTVE